MDALGKMSLIQEIMDRWNAETITSEEAIAEIEDVLAL